MIIVYFTKKVLGNQNEKMKMEAKKYFFMALSSLFCYFSACDSSKKHTGITQLPEEDGISDIAIKFKSPNREYKRDSLFVVATIWQFIKKEVSPFHYYTAFNIPLDKISIDVDSIFYSPDKLKLFAFVIITSVEDEHNLDILSYNGNTVIGYRNNINSIWNIYNFDQFSVSGFRKYNSIRKLLRNYYLGNGRFRNSSEYIWDSTNRDRVSEKFGYNLDEQNFWNNSLVWRKGARIPGYYNFQTVGNIKPDDPNAIIIMPQLQYSDSLLEMYN